MATSISGIVSDLDWQSLIDDLINVASAPITIQEEKQETLQDKYDEWDTVISLLSSLETSASALSSVDDFDLYASNSSISGSDSSVEDLMTIAVGSTASEGSYTIMVDNLATAQKLSSKSFSSTDEALGIFGEVVINSQVLTIEESDSLSDIQSSINALNSGDDASGVTASIITASTGEYRLTLTSEDTGDEGISIANGSSSNILSELGLADDALTLRNAITGGAQSWSFSSTTETIADDLGLTGASSGTITIAGVEVSIDLSSDSLEDIASTINGNASLQAAGVSASIVSSTDEDDETVYSLQVDGTQSFTDSGNILQTLGILEQGFADVEGVTGSTGNTENGSVITGDTLMSDIDGYNTWTSGDTIIIGGTDHDGNTVDATFTITEDSTVGDLLDAVESTFGNDVSAYIDSNGAIVVEDNQSGDSSLTLSLSTNIANVNATLDFGTFSVSTIRQRELVAGEDAQISIDGITISSCSNTINDAITGVTLKLTNEDEGATITLDIERDTDGVKTLIEEFVDDYNAVMDEIAEQNTVTTGDSDDEEETTTGTLFGDSTLRSIKSTLRSTIISSVEGLDSTLDALSLIGITTDLAGQLSIDDDTLDGYLETNFDEVMNLFVAQSSTDNSSLEFVQQGDSMTAGDYEVEITQAATKASVVGSGFSGSLSAEATITVMDGNGNEATIALSAGSDMSGIVDAINSGLDSDGVSVTATMEDGQLVLSNDAYGSSSFTTSISGGDLGITDGTYTGTDVDGQIRLSGSDTWITMTGSGQTLTGDDDTDVDELVIKYTGTETGTYTLTYTKGVGQSLSEALDSMIDSRDGYVVGQQESVQEHIDRIDDKIEKMETRLDKYYQTLYNKYVAMETLISTMQSQSSWLESMIGEL